MPERRRHSQQSLLTNNQREQGLYSLVLAYVNTSLASLATKKSRPAIRVFSRHARRSRGRFIASRDFELIDRPLGTWVFSLIYIKIFALFVIVVVCLFGFQLGLSILLNRVSSCPSGPSFHLVSPLLSLFLVFIQNVPLFRNFGKFSQIISRGSANNTLKNGFYCIGFCILHVLLHFWDFGSHHDLDLYPNCRVAVLYSVLQFPFTYSTIYSTSCQYFPKMQKLTCQKCPSFCKKTYPVLNFWRRF